MVHLIVVRWNEAKSAHFHCKPSVGSVALEFYPVVNHWHFRENQCFSLGNGVIVDRIHTCTHMFSLSPSLHLPKPWALLGPVYISLEFSIQKDRDILPGISLLTALFFELNILCVCVCLLVPVYLAAATALSTRTCLCTNFLDTWLKTFTNKN